MGASLRASREDEKDVPGLDDFRTFEAEECRAEGALSQGEVTLPDATVTQQVTTSFPAQAEADEDTSSAQELKLH